MADSASCRILETLRFFCSTKVFCQAGIVRFFLTALLYHVFIPGTIKVLDDDVFYIEDFGFLNHYFVQLLDGEFKIVSYAGIEQYPRLFVQTGNIPLKFVYFNTRIEDLLYIQELDKKQGRIREFQIPEPIVEGVQYFYNHLYMDETGGILLYNRIPSHRIHSAEEKSQYYKFYYIPRKTIEKYSSKWHE